MRRVFIPVIAGMTLGLATYFILRSIGLSFELAVIPDMVIAFSVSYYLVGKLKGRKI